MFIIDFEHDNRAILVFELPEKTEKSVKKNGAQIEERQNSEVQIEEVLKDELQEETAEAVSMEE